MNALLDQGLITNEDFQSCFSELNEPPQMVAACDEDEEDCTPEEVEAVTATASAEAEQYNASRAMQALVLRRQARKRLHDCIENEAISKRAATEEEEEEPH